MDNFRQYRKEEVVVEILDTEFAPHVYVFGNGMVDAESKFQASANNRSGVFLKGRATNDRQGDTVMINASKVRKYKVTKVEVPERIKTTLDELKALREAPLEEGEEFDTGREMELMDELRFYFDA